MARYDANQSVDSSARVRIIGKEIKDGGGYTVYVIQVSLERYSWTLRRRYSQFVELDKLLTKRWDLENCCRLPPKKIFGRQNDEFLQRRMNELEAYLQDVMRRFPKIPAPLASFLDFPIYEIHGIVQKLSTELFFGGDSALASKESYIFSPLHLNAISERMKLPEPPCDSEDKSQDLGHVLDFISQLENATIIGKATPLFTSNIVPNQLGFDFLRFRNLRHLKIQGYPPSLMSGLETIRKTLVTLEIRSSISSVKDMLLCDLMHSDMTEDVSPNLCWPNLKKADFAFNNLTSIDNSIRLLCKVEDLNLSHNNIRDIRHLESLPALHHLDLSFNNFSNLEALHTRLGNIVTLNMTDNNIERLRAFSKLYSLTTLDLTSNKISHVSEVTHLAKLPCLENLMLVANPVTVVIDYRTRILELFESRASELCLDNELATVKEIGTVAIRLALRKGREAGVEDNSLSVAVRPHSTNHLVTSINLSDDAGATADTKSNDKEPNPEERYEPKNQPITTSGSS